MVLYETTISLFVSFFFFFFSTSSVEESTCSFSQPPFPAHCREFTRLFVRKFSSLLYVHKHPGNFTSHSWNVQNLSVRVLVSLLCPTLILLEEDKDFMMRPKKKRKKKTTNFMENFALSQSCHATDMQRKISLCIAHNKKGTYNPLSLYFQKTYLYQFSFLYTMF